MFYKSKFKKEFPSLANIIDDKNLVHNYLKDKDFKNFYNATRGFDEAREEYYNWVNNRGIK